ncbi:MAG: isoleucine--tRNA ligase [Nanoarchaeota archaeon]
MEEKNVNDNEALIRAFWEKNRVYEKCKKMNAKGKKFYFMDGPPYATGSIHMGTALNKILKDIAMRSKRQQGYDVFDRPGYDTHGIPIEFQVEKEIGSTGKQDIEKHGVKEFIEKCKNYATKHIDIMNKQFENLGVWMDFKNPYITLNDEYIEAIWYAFKQAHEKKLLYLGKYPVHICTRCATAVAYNEIEYGKKTDKSVYVKFPLKDKKNTHLIIWTTTPWTLPGNTGVMVNPDVNYQEIETSNGEKWIIAKDLVSKLMGEIGFGFTVKSEMLGKKMKDWKYENPLSAHLAVKTKNAYKVVLSSRYVTTEDGTGLVHCAPGHGKEDYEVGKENGLDIICPVNIEGKMTSEAGKYQGMKAKEANEQIIKDLEESGKLVYIKNYEHEYPLCWRDKSPLLMVAQPQWFLKISQIQKELMKENDKTYWVPDYMKLRMKAWLEGIGDWPISRQRYWGTPLPIWVDESDLENGERIVVGSIDELRKLSGKKKIGMHKPDIDEITIKGKNGKVLKRVPEVLDVWFDSGVSSWAALGYPQNKENFKKYWPADLNIEGKDQFRGWWNSQLILSYIAFGKKPFDAVQVHGMVLDIGKKKMSKSLGNFISPETVIEKYGRDYLRYYFAKFSKGEDFSYKEDEFREINKVVTILKNINNYLSQLEKKKGKTAIEDKWILSRFYSVLKKSTEYYNLYRFPDALQCIEEFLVFDLSRTYIQMTRERSEETYSTLNEIMKGLLQMLAPIIPYLTESIWREMNENKIVKEESVHLSGWPKFEKKKVDEELEGEMKTVLKAIEVGLSERDKAKIGLKWPLADVTLELDENLGDELKEIIARQLNVKKVSIKKVKGKEIKVTLDLKMTPELEAEGYSRELARKIQAERKNVGLKKGELIELEIFADKNILEYFKRNKVFLMERTNSSKIVFSDADAPNTAIVSTIKELKISFIFRNYKGMLSEKI